MTPTPENLLGLAITALLVAALIGFLQWADDRGSKRPRD